MRTRLIAFAALRSCLQRRSRAGGKKYRPRRQRQPEIKIGQSVPYSARPPPSACGGPRPAGRGEDAEPTAGGINGRKIDLTPRSTTASKHPPKALDGAPQACRKRRHLLPSSARSARRPTSRRGPISIPRACRNSSCRPGVTPRWTIRRNSAGPCRGTTRFEFEAVAYSKYLAQDKPGAAHRDPVPERPISGATISPASARLLGDRATMIVGEASFDLTDRRPSIPR